MCHHVYVMMPLKYPVPLFGEEQGIVSRVAGFFLLIPSITALHISNTVLSKDVKTNETNKPISVKTLIYDEQVFV